MSEHLSSISPSTLDELFSKDPFEMADADIEKIVDVLREQRKNWSQAEGQAAAKTKAGKKTMTAEDFAKLTSSLGI